MAFNTSNKHSIVIFIMLWMLCFSFASLAQDYIPEPKTKHFLLNDDLDFLEIPCAKSIPERLVVIRNEEEYKEFRRVHVSDWHECLYAEMPFIDFKRSLLVATTTHEGCGGYVQSFKYGYSVDYNTRKVTVSIGAEKTTSRGGCDDTHILILPIFPLSFSFNVENYLYDRDY